MGLEVGMYVRTKYGIRKITNIGKDKGYNKPRIKVIELDEYVYTKYKFNYIFYTDEKVIKDIKKASFNIIDLIEVGDYVNGYKVSFKGDDYQPFVQCDYPVEEGSTNHYRFYEKAIYSIVTKEQFEQMSYKVGDEK